MLRQTFIITVLLLTVCSYANAQPKIKIACIGNSITYGTLVENREKNNYPAQLQNMLGNKYDVKNFGVSGRTLLRKGNHPYWKENAFYEALIFNPNIVTIMLGTNDSKAVNRPYYNEFEKDYTDLIDSFKILPSHPRIILLLPIPSFYEDRTSIYNPVIKEQIIPRIQNAAYKTGCEVLNLYALFIDKPDLLADKIHPTSLGATVIAKHLYEAVMRPMEKKVFDIFSNIKQQKTFSSFYGYRCADFMLNNHNCKVVAPKVSAPGHPWVWRARFWGHEPQTDISLLERGFHIVYCDVAEMFGNKEAIDVWNKFYALMQQAGLSKKVALEGMSRGGVYVYNWALANPGQVSCIYADAPVLDLKSWPGGKGKSAGSKDDWEAFKKDYNLTEEQAINFNNNPLDNAANIAKLGFPMLHVVGDADDVVPVAENTAPFEQKIKAAGGDITVIHKPGVNHHPHSLPNPTLITNFILRSTGYKINFATIADPGAEYRSGAGWTEGKDWWAQAADIDSLLLSEKNIDILFLGNSITQGMGGHRTYVTYKAGFNSFDSVFSKYNWECAGISGDRTQNVLWRLQHGNYATAKPKLIVLTIGVNNFLDDDSPQEIADGIFTICKWIKTNMPSTKLLLSGPLPAGTNKDDAYRRKYDAIQSILAKSKLKGVDYFPVEAPFLLPDGSRDLNKCAKDGIHLKAAGYNAWAIALQPEIEKILSQK